MEETDRTYKKVEIATQTAPAIQDKDGKVFTMEDAVVELLNRVDELKRMIV